MLYVFKLVGLIHQYKISSDKEARVAEFNGFQELLVSLYPWNKASKSLDYNVDLFKFLIIRICVAEYPFDFFFMFLLVPAYLWQYYMGRLLEWGWCGMDSFGTELVCGIFCLLTWKIAR